MSDGIIEPDRCFLIAPGVWMERLTQSPETGSPQKWRSCAECRARFLMRPLSPETRKYCDVTCLQKRAQRRSKARKLAGQASE